LNVESSLGTGSDERPFLTQNVSKGQVCGKGDAFGKS
jgi:hypothetical protein